LLENVLEARNIAIFPDDFVLYDTSCSSSALVIIKILLESVLLQGVVRLNKMASHHYIDVLVSAAFGRDHLQAFTRLLTVIFVEVSELFTEFCAKNLN